MLKIVLIHPYVHIHPKDTLSVHSLSLQHTHTGAGAGCDWAGSLGQMVYEAGCWVGGGECVWGGAERLAALFISRHSERGALR